MTGTDLTTDKHQGGTKTAATGALAVVKNLDKKNVPTMTGVTAGGNAAKRSREVRLLLETGCLLGGHAKAAGIFNGTMLLCVTTVPTGGSTSLWVYSSYRDEGQTWFYAPLLVKTP